ncbi:hypothetical protein VNI00_011001 [Paramarasmius palmivorus]|uniref:Fungal-type protein kinase domain-containing protein n=1 Tax=Paramarasmius palmivorus TaxID=297713 RepID=A0AAW0CI54_9AGAR
MLSPKTLKTSGIELKTEWITHSSTRPSTVMKNSLHDPSFPDSTNEQSFDELLTKFPDDSIQGCHDASNAQLEDEVSLFDNRWNRALQFVKYGKEATVLDYCKSRFVVLGTIGESLLDVKSSWELCEAIIHALLGWLNHYQAGYLHRDISIANVICLKKPRMMEPYKISVPADVPTDFDIQEPLALEMQQVSIDDEQTSMAADSISQQPTSASNPEQVFMDADFPGSQTPVGTVEVPESVGTDPSSYAIRIKVALEKLGVTSQCKAILIDGDKAANWKSRTYDLHTKSGTPEFMSFGLRDAMERSVPYLQSPVDVLHSFFWVTMWAVMFNELNKERSEFEKHCHYLLVGDAVQREGVLKLMNTALRSKVLFTEPTSPILKQMATVLIEWHRSLDTLDDDWMTQVLGSRPGSAGRGWFLPYFHRFAFRGLAELLELMLKHRQTLMEYEPFRS